MSTNAPTDIPRLSVVVPVFNEADRLPASLEKMVAFLSAHRPGYEVVLVDDGSTDGTMELVREGWGERPEIRIESYGENRGKGYAVRRGMRASRGERVLFTDADLSTPIEEVDKLSAALDAGADVAVGTRADPRSQVQVRQPFYRDLGGKLFNLCVRLLLLPDLHDTQCGFKMFRRAAVAPLLERLTIDRFAFDVELLCLCRAAGLEIREVPVIWINSPDSRVRMRHALAAFWDVVALRRRLGRQRS